MSFAVWMLYLGHVLLVACDINYGTLFFLSNTKAVILSTNGFVEACLLVGLSIAGRSYGK